LRFNEFGDPAVLHVTDMPDPPATVQEAVIQVDSASVNPSDVKNVAGVMEGTVLPRIPGRDFAGRGYLCGGLVRGGGNRAADSRRDHRDLWCFGFYSATPESSMSPSSSDGSPRSQ
jgi:hypothetical protein